MLYCPNDPRGMGKELQCFPKVLNPGKAGHASLDGGCICSIKVPNFSFKGRRRRYSEINFAINYLMVTEGI